MGGWDVGFRDTRVWFELTDQSSGVRERDGLGLRDWGL